MIGQNFVHHIQSGTIRFLFPPRKAGSHNLKVPEGSSGTGAVLNCILNENDDEIFTTKQHCKATGNQCHAVVVVEIRYAKTNTNPTNAG